MPCISAARWISEKKSMRNIVAEVELYAHGWTYELQNVGTSYGLSPSKILYRDRIYRVYLNQFVLYSYRAAIGYFFFTYIFFFYSHSSFIASHFFLLDRYR